MMNNILIVPDVHGRSFWREPLEKIDEFDHVIFLGDYVDPYPGEATYEEALQSFKDIISLKKQYSDKITLLIGNHCCHYMYPEYCKATSARPRYDYQHFKEISNIYEENKKLFQIAWKCDNEKYGRVLFTHAGVTNKFKHICGLDAELINKFFLEEYTEDVPNITGLASISWYRGGYNDTGSPVWADVREHIKSQVPQVFQIFGHTYCKEIIIKEHFAMLDTGNSCYILNNSGINKFE